MKDHLAPGWKLVLNGVAFGGVFFTLAGLIWFMYHYTQPPPPDTAYWAQRYRNLADLHAQTEQLLDNYGWIDATRGVVRLPIARAMDLTVTEWQHPEAARSNLLARAQRMAPPVPVAPAKALGTNASAKPPAPANAKP